MSLNTVTLTWDLSNFIQTGLQAKITLVPTAVLTDPTDELVIPEIGYSVRFLDGVGQLAGVIACDNTQITPSGWAYAITVFSESGQTIVGPFNAFINHAAGATQDLSELTPVQSAVIMQAYLPVPGGAATPGYVPVATGTGDNTNWGLPGSGAYVPISDLPISIGNGGTGQSTAQTALDTLTGTQTAGYYLRSDGTNAALAAIRAADVPALPYDTSGAAAAAQAAAEAASLPITGGSLTGGLAPAGHTLTYGATIPVGAVLGNDFPVTLTGNAELLNPTGLRAWQVIRVHVTQGGTGSYTLAYGTAYNFGTAGAPTLSTTVGDVDVLAFIYNPNLTALCYLGSGLGF